MLAQDILIKGAIVPTLSGPCIVEGWEGKAVRVIFPSGYRPLLRPDKLLNGTVLNYDTLPEPARSQIQDNPALRLVVHFYDGSFIAFKSLQEIANYTGQHLNSVARVYKGKGYNSLIASVKDVFT